MEQESVAMGALTPENLDLLKRLQPKIKEAMGELLEGDLIYDILFERTRIWPKCVGKEFYVIPKPIDWQNPERGLWGMIDWKWHDIKRVADSGKVFLTGADVTIGYQDPFTALLKALTEQEGV